MTIRNLKFRIKVIRQTHCRIVCVTSHLGALKYGFIFTNKRLAGGSKVYKTGAFFSKFKFVAAVVDRFVKNGLIS